MKRLEEAGGNPNDIPTTESDHGMYDGQVEQSIVIRMKDHTEYLGMFEYKKDNEQRIFKALVYGKLDVGVQIHIAIKFLENYNIRKSS